MPWHRLSHEGTTRCCTRKRVATVPEPVHLRPLCAERVQRVCTRNPVTLPMLKCLSEMLNQKAKSVASDGRRAREEDEKAGALA